MQDPISMETIDEIWQNLAEMQEDEAVHIVEQMTAEQPHLQSFLLSLDEEDFNQEEQEIIFFLGNVLWEIMRQSYPQMGMVTEDTIDQAEDENMNFMESIETEDPNAMEGIIMNMLETYPEPAVLSYLLESLMEESEDPEEIDIDDEMKGAAFLHLKIALDAMIKTAQNP
jgi:hypothetical protein